MSLMHCPFCGAIPEMIDQMGIAWIECFHCGAQGPTADTGDEAQKLWEIRYPTPPSTE